MRLDLMLQKDSPANAGAPAATAPAPVATAPKNQTEFDQLLDSLYDATILTDDNGYVVTANRRAFDFFQTKLDEIQTKQIEQLIAGTDQKILQIVRVNIAKQRFTLLQAFCIRTDQSMFPAEVSVTAVVRDSKPCLCFSVRDTTVRREVEERLRIEGEAIRNAGDGIVITNAEGIMTYVNPAVARLWHQQTREDALGKPISTLFPTAQGLQTAVRAAVKNGDWNGELEATRSDMQPLYLQSNITASRDDNQCITHLIFSFADITERRKDEIALRAYQNHLEELIQERTQDLEATNAELRHKVEERREAEEKLRRAIDQLRQHDKAKSVFVSNVSHELRTPLTALINSLENLMRGVIGDVPPPVASYFNMMLEDCWRLERTINDILDLSKMEKGTFELVQQPLPFAPLIQRTAEVIRMSAETIPLKYAVAYKPFAGFVDCDAAKIARALLNILSNALKFTPPAGTCTVTCRHLQRAGAPALACEVTDSGVGIPDDCIDRVTERFYRIGEQVEGTGLGLAIAREIVEKHGGGIEIASPPPNQTKGTLVRFWLPRHRAPNILMALPQTQLSNALQKELRQRDYEVDYTCSGVEAIQHLRDTQHFAVLIGPNLPDMSATETIMHIMADAVLRNTTLFFLSEKPLDQTKSGLLQGFQIPCILVTDDIPALVDQIENACLPASRTHNENHAASSPAAA